MKKILCYGDSNTFGFVPQTGTRYVKNERWSGILGEILPSDYCVIEEGMNNRTGFFRNPDGLKYSGAEYLPLVLKKHKDIDIFILALGTNDAQFFYNLDENTARSGLQKLIDSVLGVNTQAKIILVPPVKIDRTILDGMFSVLFDEKSIERINQVFPIFEQIAKEKGCYFFDFNQIVRPSKQDGLHYTKESHKIIAEKLADFVIAKLKTEHLL